MTRFLSLASVMLLLLGGSANAQPRPMIQVHEGAIIPPNSGGITPGATVDFGTAKVATVANRVFTIRNVGTADLVLSEPIHVPPGFTVMRTFGRTTVGPNETTTFVAALNAAAAGRYQGGPISFVTNDPDRNPFSFIPAGSALPEAALRIVDQGDSGFRTVGSWTSARGSAWGYQNNAVYKEAGSGSGVASWTFKGLTPGLYQVAATWSPYLGWAPDARFTIRDGATAVDTQLVDQRNAPGDFFDAALGWQNLGGPVLITGDTLVVQLSDQATAGTYVVADAVRVERAGYVGRVIDDDAGFTFNGPWVQDFQRGFHGDARYAAGGSAATATWTFAGLPAGQYRVSATWREGPNRATNASFTVRNGATTLATVPVNQRVAPKDISDGAARWTDLGAVGTVYTTTGANPLVVELSAAGANGVVVADAVRVERVNTPVQPTTADVVRLLEQATFGPNAASITQVQRMGIPAWVDQQLGLPISGYPTRPVKHNDRNFSITGTPYSGCLVSPQNVDATCVRENYTHYLMSRSFFTNAFYQPDQLRQKMAWNLHKIIVTDARGLREYGWRFTAYLQILDWSALGNYRLMLYVMSLNPNMGDYLDMMRSTRVRPNENYARELLQLFSVGLDELHPDGSPILDAQGNRIPTYNQADVEEFTKVLTGWQRQPPLATNVDDWINIMDVRLADHDPGAKTLLQRSPGGRSVPAGPNPLTFDYAWQSFDAVIENVFTHPNIGPYICRQLIQMMVTSNPTPGYVARVSAVFDRNRGSATQMGEVARAILLDPEARGDIKTDPNYGRLREPAQLMTNMARAFGVTGYNNQAIPSDGVISLDIPNAGNNQMSPLDQDVFRPPSVFSYFLQDNMITGTNLRGPEYQIYSTLGAVRRHNFFNTMLNPNEGGVGATFGIAPNAQNGNQIPNGTKLDFRALVDLSPQQLMDEFDLVMFGNRMPAAMKARILQAISVPQITTGLRRAKTAMYLVVTAPEWMVQR